MPRVKKNYNEIVTRIAFLSVNGSEAAQEKVRLIMQTLEMAGLSEEVRTDILTRAQELAESANDI